VALAAGEWWRLITPLLVHSDGWQQIIVDFAGIAIVGPVVERLFGSYRWLILYFVAGLIAEVVSYAWDPYGAGSSIALCGLIGGLFMWLIRRKELGRPSALMFALGLVAALIGSHVGGIIAAAVGAGLAGSLLGMLFRRDSSERTIARFVGIAGLLGALTLTALRDHHGPPILVGAGLAALLWRQRSSAPAARPLWKRHVQDTGSTER
jgi:membrane associated rhomboid family serine protease